jgi:hypothetical protein
MKPKSILGTMAVVAVFAISSAVFGQATGGLTGTVRDQNGAVIQGATVTSWP